MPLATVNPLSAKSDRHHYFIKHGGYENKGMITRNKISLCLNKFSQIVSGH